MALSTEILPGDQVFPGYQVFQDGSVQLEMGLMV